MSSSFTDLGDASERYRLLVQLGTGGMADIYLAVQRGASSFQRLVVVKKIRRSFLDHDSAHTMFLDEAQTVAALDHPAIVRLFEFGRLGPDPCIVMEYVNGESLGFIFKELSMRGEYMPPRIVCRLLADVCDALHAAHTAAHPDGTPLKLVHRDVSPHNLMLDRNGHAKVIDFGIAKSAAQLQETAPGTVKGKFSYLAPEALTGDLDARTDVYGLGLVLFEALVGRQAMEHKEGMLDEVVQTIARAPIPPPSQVGHAGVSTLFDPVVAKATDKIRKRRYQSAEALGIALREVGESLGGLPRSVEVRDWFLEQFVDRVTRRRAMEQRVFESAQEVTEERLGPTPSHPELLLPVVEVSDMTIDIDPEDLSKLVVATPAPAPPAPARLSWLNAALAAALFLLLGIIIARELAPQPAPPAPQAPAPAPAMRGPNLLVLSFPEDAQIKVDGVAHGSAGPNGRTLSVTPGIEHTIELERAGYAPYVLDFTGAADGQQRLVARLDPLPRDAGAPTPPPALADRVAGAEAPVAAATPTRPRRRPRARVVAPQDPVPVDVEPAPEPAPEPDPEPAPVVAEVEPEPKAPRYLSGGARWTGRQVFERGCPHCHDGSMAPRISASAFSAREWRRIFRRASRHDRYAALGDLFSPDELVAARRYAMGQVDAMERSARPKRNVAGVQ